MNKQEKQARHEAKLAVAGHKISLFNAFMAKYPLFYVYSDPPRSIMSEYRKILSIKL